MNLKKDPKDRTSNQLHRQNTVGHGTTKLIFSQNPKRKNLVTHYGGPKNKQTNKTSSNETNNTQKRTRYKLGVRWKFKFFLREWIIVNNDFGHFKYNNRQNVVTNLRRIVRGPLETRRKKLKEVNYSKSKYFRVERSRQVFNRRM